MTLKPFEIYLDEAIVKYCEEYPRARPRPML
jgi:hypothetical protein